MITDDELVDFPFPERGDIPSMQLEESLPARNASTGEILRESGDVIFHEGSTFSQSSVGADVYMPDVSYSFDVPEGGATAYVSLEVDDWGKITIEGPGVLTN